MIFLSSILNLAMAVYSILILVRGIVIWAKVDENNSLVQFVTSVTEPVLSKVRPMFPKATFDVSPIVVIVALWVLSFVLGFLMFAMTPKAVYYGY